MNEKGEKLGLVESINQPGELWFTTAIAQFRLMNGCCEQVSGCCQRVSAQLTREEIIKQLGTRKTG
jgi:hypothetical protein